MELIDHEIQKFNCLAIILDIGEIHKYSGQFAIAQFVVKIFSLLRTVDMSWGSLVLGLALWLKKRSLEALAKALASD